MLVVSVVATAATACGAVDGELDIEAQSANLTLDPENNGGFLTEFKSNWGQVTPLEGEWVEAILDPTMCTDVQRAFLTFNMDALGAYRVLANMSGGFAPEWKAWGNRTFNSRPACAMLPDSDPVRSKFLLIGRGAWNNASSLLWSRGNWDATGFPNNPTAETQWAPISTDTYTTNANPAAATSPNSGRVAVAFLGNNNELLAHIRDTNGVWGSRQSGPTNLPSGWTATGTPAIAYIGSLSRFMVVVRAKNSTNQNRFYYTFLGPSGFVGVPSGQPVAFTRLTLKTGAVHLG